MPPLSAAEATSERLLPVNCNASPVRQVYEQQHDCGVVCATARFHYYGTRRELSAPVVSVVLPVYNGAAFVPDAIESVLAQADVAVELVVVDDGSTDQTPALLAQLGDRVVLVRQPNRGLAAARNAGIRAARSEYLIFLDADDLQPAGYVARFLDAARNRADADVWHCGWRAVDFEGHELYANPRPLDIDADPFHQLLLTGSPHIGALLVRRSTVARAGGFDESLTLQEDWDFWLRLAATGARFCGVPGNVFIIRRHPTSMSGRAGSALALSGLEIVERHLAVHGACVRCTGREALESWRRTTLRASAQAMNKRLGVPGRAGRWLGTAAAVLRTPRVAPAALKELTERRKARRQGP